MNKHIKKLIILSVIMILSVTATCYAGTLVKKVYFSTFPIIIDGKDYSSESPILTYQNRTYVALREFSQMVGVNIDFKNQQIYIDTSTKEDVNNKELSSGSNEKTNVNLNQNKEDININKLVYVSKTGGKYHINNKCSSSLNYSIALTDAIDDGYEACLKCVKNTP